jgi:hypothetical protein
MSLAPTQDLRTLAQAPTKRQLIEALEGTNYRPLSLSGDSGETIVVLPQGGRVLGLYSSASESNFLWTSAAISSAELAREHFASNRWCNSGGDRTWLAPEIDFFYPHYPDTGRQYFQPRQLDPGRYQASRTPTWIRLENILEMQSFRRGWTAPMRITKTVRATNNPLGESGATSLAADLEFAGYELHTSLDLLGDDENLPEVGIWNLLQLPGGGDLIVPTLRSTHPATYFGDIPAGDLRGDQHSVRYAMRAPNEQKIGIEALALTGRAGYVRAEQNDLDVVTLVVRNFFVRPHGVYVDVPLHSSERGGHAFQACNIDADYLGHFAELEYHAPAIGGRSGAAHSDDVSQVYAYRGSQAAIAAAAYELLGVVL